VFTDTPVVVEYELTDYAKPPGGVLQALSDWGAKHKEMNAIVAALVHKPTTETRQEESNKLMNTSFLQFSIWKLI
jgi:DNA-binding HxlR family transcriptional regulator